MFQFDTSILSSKALLGLCWDFTCGVPDNLILFFQPSHSPELNFIKQVWQYLKCQLRWLMPRNLKQLRSTIYSQLSKLTKSIVVSITRRS